MNPVITAIISIISQVVGGMTETKQKELELALQQNKLIADLSNAQAATNTEEAKNPNLFVSGARPFVMWICGFAFAYAFVVQPMLIFIFTVSGHPVPPLPALDTASMTTVLLGMLGLGWMRSYDKKNGLGGS